MHIYIYIHIHKGLESPCGTPRRKKMQRSAQRSTQTPLPALTRGSLRHALRKAVCFAAVAVPCCRWTGPNGQGLTRVPLRSWQPIMHQIQALQKKWKVIHWSWVLLHSCPFLPISFSFGNFLLRCVWAIKVPPLMRALSRRCCPAFRQCW